MLTIQKLLQSIFGRSRLKPKQLATMSPRSVFEAIYERNAWKGTESVSGLGSDHQQTSRVAAELPRVLQEINAKSLLDIPCGDFYWMKDVDLTGIQYTGADIVLDLVEGNKKYENESRTFIHCDLMTSRLPSAEVIFCRDCLVHFSNEHVWQTLRNIAQSDARYLITTTFTQRANKKSIVTGQWRPLNLQASPFNLPAPLNLIDEQCTQDDGAYPDKMLGLWSVETIRTAVGEHRNAA